jgi:hypothetical protein
MGKVLEFREDEQGTVRFKNRICVPRDQRVARNYLEGST